MHSRLFLPLSLLFLLATALLVSAAPTVEEIPLAPHGDLTSWVSAPALPLTPTTLLLSTGRTAVADERLLIVTDVGSTPQVSATFVGLLPFSGGRFTRMSATRGLYEGGGADEAWGTGDETLIMVDRVGSDNAISQVPGVSMQQNQGRLHVPVRLSPDTAVFAVQGADDTQGTADDAIALVTDLGGTPQVTPLPAPHLFASGRAQAVALSPTSFLVASTGPDELLANGDDLLHLFTDVGGTNTRTGIPIPNLHWARPGCPRRVTSTTAVMVSAGPDETSGTADDRVYVVSGLGTTNTVTSVNVPYIPEWAAGRPRVLGPDRIAVSTWGADGAESTADDTIAVVTSLGTTNDVLQVVVGPLHDERECRPARLSPNRVAIPTLGPDATGNNADDRIAVVSDIGGANTVSYIDVPGCTLAGVSELVPISTTSFLLLSGGADGASCSGNDDVFTLVTGIGGTPIVESVPLGPTGGQAVYQWGMTSRPTLTGGGRALAFGSGPDGLPLEGDDGLLHVIEGLPRDRDVTVAKLSIKFNAAKPEKGEKFKVQAMLALDDPTLFGMGDLTVSIGNAAETIPADLIALKNGKYAYKAPKDGTGLITKLKYDSRKGILKVSGKGVGTGGETTDADFVPFTLDIPDTLFVGDVIAGEAGKSGIKYKAPK